MRIHRLISILVVLSLLALAATMSLIQSPLGVVSDTVSAQKVDAAEQVADGEQSDGLSTIVASETTAQTQTDLYLDADEVEKRAAAEQAGDSSATTGPVPVSITQSRASQRETPEAASSGCEECHQARHC